MPKLFVNHMACEHKELLFSKLAPLGYLCFNLLVSKRKIEQIKFLKGSWLPDTEKNYGAVTLAFLPSAQTMSLGAKVWGT